MTHLWIRAEQRGSEQRVGITPSGVKTLLDLGMQVTVERSSCRAIGIDGYAATGCAIAAENSWPEAPKDAVIFGLKELPEDATPLVHRHIMFGHAFKGQSDGPALLARFKAGGGALYDLEYLTGADGRRVAAFGYWAGFAGAAVGLKTWVAQQAGALKGPAEVGIYAGKLALLDDLRGDLTAARSNGAEPVNAIVIGALGRVGQGACDLLESLGIEATKWDMAETRSGGPFPEILAHNLFVNCVLAGPNIPCFVPKSALSAARRLTVVADVSCDPSSDFNPVPIYSHANSFTDPVTRATQGPPPLDVTAIDNLPSMLPIEASEDYATQLLPSLAQLGDIEAGVWGRAHAIFSTHAAKV